MKPDPERKFGWGGARPGAGRKPVGDRAGVPHRTRPAVHGRVPVHVIMRTLPHVWSLKPKQAFEIVTTAIGAAANRMGTQILEFAVKGRDLHLIVEAEDEAALARAMKGLSIRLARGLNRVMGRAGKVLADRYEVRVLRTPDQVRAAQERLRQNAKSE